MAIIYAITIREGASEDEIRQLPKYRFYQSCTPRMSDSMELKNVNPIEEATLQFEDSVSDSALLYFIYYSYCLK